MQCGILQKVCEVHSCYNVSRGDLRLHSNHKKENTRAYLALIVLFSNYDRKVFLCLINSKDGNKRQRTIRAKARLHVAAM